MPDDRDVAAAEDLLRLALAQPAEAAKLAGQLVSTSADPWMLSVARHTIGIVLRDDGRPGDAVRELRAARALAVRSGDPDRLADVRATLGIALALDGRTRVGLLELDRAVAEAVSPRLRARCLMRRGSVLAYVMGRQREALADLRGALRTARREGDHIWEARTLASMSLLHLDVGEVDRAERSLEQAHRIFVDSGQVLEAVQTLHDQGFLAFARGDLTTALRLLDEASAGYAQLGEVPVELGRDRCEALLAAGLPDEASSAARELLDGDRVTAVLRPELLLFLALAELGRGDAGAALTAARTARDGFRRQRREVGRARAEVVVLAARRRTGARGTALADSARQLAERLEAARSEDAPVAWLLAGRTATEVGRDPGPLWASAARYRGHPSGLVRTTAWLAEALDRDLHDHVRGVWHACRRGLDALDEHRASMGSTELRALASVQGDELARVALTRAVASRPRSELWWSERWRATSLALPTVRPPKDRELTGLLAAMRANAAQARRGA